MWAQLPWIPDGESTLCCHRISMANFDNTFFRHFLNLFLEMMMKVEKEY